jgi:hypothetical protein
MQPIVIVETGIPNPDPNHNPSFNPNFNTRTDFSFDSMLVFLAPNPNPNPLTPLFYLHNTWDNYPDGIKMVHNERKEARRPITPNPNSNPYSSPSPNRNRNQWVLTGPNLNPNPNPKESSRQRDDDNMLPLISKFGLPSPQYSKRISSDLFRNPLYNSTITPNRHLISNPSHNFIHNHVKYINVDLFKIWFINELMLAIHSNENNRLLDYVLHTAPHVKQRIKKYDSSVVSQRPKLKRICIPISYKQTSSSSSRISITDSLKQRHSSNQHQPALTFSHRARKSTPSSFNPSFRPIPNPNPNPSHRPSVTPPSNPSRGKKLAPVFNESNRLSMI